MKQLLMIVLLLLSASSVAKDVHEIRDVKAKSEIRVVNIAGDVEVEAWSRNQVEIDADLGSDVKELIFEVNGNDVFIEVKGEKSSGRNISSDLVIKVPENSSLEITTVSADITVENVLGRLSCETVSGDIESTVFKSDVAMQSVSGDIDLQGDKQKTRTHAASVSGDIEANSLDGEFRSTTVTGDLLVVDSQFELAEMQTVNGDIVYQAALYGDSRMEVETVNGDVEIEFAGDVSARFDIETFNGSIENCFGPEPQRTGQYTPGRELKFTLGGGKGRVVIRTLNGSVSLCND